MKLYHVTHKHNLPSITRFGLLPALALGQRKAVWAVSPSKVAWAIVHVLGKARNAGATVDDVVVLEVALPRSVLTRHSRGVWYTYQTIPWTSLAPHEATSYGKSAES